MPASAALETRRLSKTFVASRALVEVDLTIGAGEIHALLGENGSGKSTLIKILAGFHRPDPGGTIHVCNRTLAFGSAHSSHVLGLRFVHQDLALINSRSVADNLLLGSRIPTRLGTVRSKQVNFQATVALERVGLTLDPDTPVGELSPALRTGVAIARALQEDTSSPASVLVLDEPTATLPNAEVHHLLEMIRAAAASGVAVLYVTHRLEEVLELADWVTVLRDGHRVASRPARDASRTDLVGLLVGRDYREAHPDVVPRSEGNGQARLDAHGLVTAQLGGVDLKLRAGEIVGVAGLTGSGRDHLLAAIFGAVPRLGGTVTVDRQALPPGRPDLAMKAGVGYLPSDRPALGALGLLTSRENVTISDPARHWRWPRLSLRSERAEINGWNERLSVRPSDPERTFASLSGGNQQKLLMARWLRRDPKVLLLDEPTQGVDIGAKAAIHDQIITTARNGAAIAISSADADELAAVSHRVIVLSEGRISRELTGRSITPTTISAACLGPDNRRG
jgi:ribose transport system ATP-binding protein